MDRTDGIGNCSITVHLRQTPQVSGRDVLFEACRVGSVNESDGSMILNWNLGEVSRLRTSMSTELVTKRLSEFVFGGRAGQLPDGDVKILQAKTSEKGTCTFSGLEEGAWLIHASDSSSYGRIEDTLVAVPYYEQIRNTWSGPVYHPDVWPKGEIQPEKPKTEKPKTEKPKTEKPQPEKPQPEKPQPEKPQPETPQPEIPRTQRQQTQKPQPEKQVTETVRTGKEKEWETEMSLPKANREDTGGGKPGKEIPLDDSTTGRKQKRKDPQMNQGFTSLSSQPVRTLDDTPLSLWICVFLSCALVIGTILLKWKKSGSRQRTMLQMMLVCCLSSLTMAAGWGGCARAEEPPVPAPEGEKRILFVNESPKAPCLTVSKEVLDAADGSRAPEGDLFLFRLFLDGHRAGGIRYRIFNESGEEFVDLTGDGTSLVPSGSVPGDPVPLRTGRDGSFYLKDGQYALFEEVSAGQLWEVWELEKEHYERVSPASSYALSGTIGRSGSAADYINRYVPPEDVEYDEGTLEITKRILWPEDVPVPDRGCFRIRVMVDGKAWTGGPLQLQDPEGESQAEKGTTDSEGSFKIRGNQKALLTGLPAGSDITVEEIDDPEDDFVPSGGTIWRGAVSSRGRITFTNRLADFTVAKTLRSGDPQHRFVFCLLGPNHLPLHGASYYLVGEDGNLTGTDPNKTDENGHFTLSGGERAIFCALEKDAVFSVREEREMGYRQLIPAEESGYTDLVVKNGIPTLLFENEQTDVRLFVPALGGSGIVLTLCIGIGGMFVWGWIIVAGIKKKGHGS